MHAAIVRLDPPKVKPHVPHPLRGFGAQFNTNLFTRDGERPHLNDDEVAALQAAIDSLGLGHSRIFVRPAARRPGPQRAALMSTIRLAQRAGANVNLTWWKGPFPHHPQRGHGERRRQLMEDFAEIVREARAHGLTCVTHLTVMNEVNSYDIAGALTPRRSMELYELLYRDLDAALRARRDPLSPSRSLRGAVSLVGGDLVEHGQNDWLEFMRSYMADVLDAYSIRVYWQPRGEFPRKPTRRLDDLRGLGIEKPVFVTEYGVRRLDATPKPGTLDGTPRGPRIEHAPETAFQHAWFNAMAPQYGCAGLVKWSLYRTSLRAEFGDWGMISPRRGPHGAFHQWPTCEVTRLFNALIGPDWKAAGLGDTTDDAVLAGAFEGPRGGHSLALLNRGRARREVRVEGLRPRRSYTVAIWSADRKGSIRRPARVVADAAGAATLTVPARGLTALSTRVAAS